MFGKTIVALIAVAALSLVAPTEASAFGRGGGFHGGGFHGGYGGWHGGGWRGGWGGPGWGAVGIGLGLGLAAPFYYGGYGYPYYGYPYDYGSYDGYGGCYLVRQRVMTSHGWRVRRVEVCD